MIIKNRFCNFADIKINGIRTSVNSASTSDIDRVILNRKTIVVGLGKPPFSFCLNVRP